MANFDCSSRATHSRVRRAIVKRVPTSDVQLLPHLRWAKRLEGSLPTHSELRIGRSSAFGGTPRGLRLGRSWMVVFPIPAASGHRVTAPSCTVAVRRVPAWSRPELELAIRPRRCPARATGSRLSLGIDGARDRNLDGGWRGSLRRVGQCEALRGPSSSSPFFEVALELDEKVEWADDNKLGLHLRTIGMRTGLLRQPCEGRSPRRLERRSTRSVARARPVCAATPH